jgi:DNA polymerase elongation subunit (family B)
MTHIDISSFDCNNSSHLEYIFQHPEYYTDVELQSIYNTLDVDIKTEAHNTFISYNIYDVILLVQMEDKLKLFNTLLSIAYLKGCNYLDTFATVKPWDCDTHHYLMDRNIVVPPIKFVDHYEGIEGAYVKNPNLGVHKWVLSVDFKSLYPSLDIQCNISPETIVATIPGITVDMILNRQVPEKVLQKIKEQNVSLCATGCVFDNSEEGFIPAIMREAFEERTKVKGKIKKVKKEISLIQEELAKRKLTVQ